MKTPSQNDKLSKPSRQRVATRRRLAARKQGQRCSQVPGSSHWLRNGLCAAYMLAIVWFSLGKAAGDSSITTGPVASVSRSVAAFAPMARHFSRTGFELGTPGSSGTARAIRGRDNVQGYVHGAARAGGVDPRVAEWIVYHESRHEPHALGDGGESRGLWQINKVWHPEVSDRCAYDVRCSTRWSIQRIHDGYVNEWSTWKYRKSWFRETPPDPIAPAK